MDQLAGGRGAVTDEERVYTVEEANAALPELRERLARIRDARQTMLRAATVVKERVVADGGGAHADPAYWEAPVPSEPRSNVSRRSGSFCATRRPGWWTSPASGTGRRCTCAGAWARTGSLTGIRSTPASRDDVLCESAPRSP